MTATSLPLRPYQRDALDAVWADWSAGIQRPAVVAPTGAGKTVMFSHLAKDHLERHARATNNPARRFASRVVVLVHRDELADQALDKLRQIMPDPEVRLGKVKAQDNQVDADVIVASVPTLANGDGDRLAQLVGGADGKPIGLVIVDECHHAVAPTWRGVLEDLGCFLEIPAGLHGDLDEAPLTVGFSATLARGDQVGLGSVWTKVSYSISLTRLIRRGHLVDPKGYRIKVGDLELDKVRRSGGDYSAAGLGAALEDSDAADAVAWAYQEHAKDRAGVVFTPTVETAETMAERLEAAGFVSRVVTGATPRDERQRIYTDYASGAVQILVNCMVLTEGWDAPWASCAVIARPTQSAPLYTQMVGRVLRPWPGKKDAVVLDVVGASSVHKLATLIDLEAGAVQKIEEGQTLTEAIAEEHTVREGAFKRLDDPQYASAVALLFDQSTKVWLQTEAGVWFISGPSGFYFVWPGAEPGTWDSCVAPDPIDGKRQPWQRIHTGCTLELAMSWTEVEAEEGGAAGFNLTGKDASWRRSGKASDAQKGYLKGLGYRGDMDELSKKDASDLISKIKAGKVFDRYYRKVMGQ